jgi:hypothetical protein
MVAEPSFTPCRAGRRLTIVPKSPDITASCDTPEHHSLLQIPRSTSYAAHAEWSATQCSRPVLDCRGCSLHGHSERMHSLIHGNSRQKRKNVHNSRHVTSASPSWSARNELSTAIRSNASDPPRTSHESSVAPVALTMDRSAFGRAGRRASLATYAVGEVGGDVARGITGV